MKRNKLHGNLNVSTAFKFCLAKFITAVDLGGLEPPIYPVNCEAIFRGLFIVPKLSASLKTNSFNFAIPISLLIRNLGGLGRTRTAYLLIANEMFYPLNYEPKLADKTGSRKSIYSPDFIGVRKDFRDKWILMYFNQLNFRPEWHRHAHNCWFLNFNSLYRNGNWRGLCYVEKNLCESVIILQLYIWMPFHRQKIILPSPSMFVNMFRMFVEKKW